MEKPRSRYVRPEYFLGQENLRDDKLSETRNNQLASVIDYIVLRLMREHLYSVYIMASRSGVLYTGITSDLQHRVGQHKNGVIEGFTKRYRCHRLVYYERYDYVQTAIGREKQIKAYSRKKRIALIESMNPRWQDLSESWGREFLVPCQSMKQADEENARRIKLQIPLK